MTRINEPLGRKLRMGLIGGAGSGFIGRVHAAAAVLDRRAELTAGALSSDPEKARQAAPEFGIAPERAYESSAQMLADEAARPADQRIDFVTIATPNFTHYPLAAAALAAGFHVVCDKPMTIDSGQARQLVERTRETGLVFVVTHNYSGYPLIRQARQMARGGELGEIEAVRVSYLQSGLRGWEPGKAPPRGAWKADPEKAGPAGTLADIGTHAYHLARYASGLEPREVACNLQTFFPGRRLDDYGHVTIRFADGAIGALTVSQVTHGRLNDLTLEIDGSSGSIRWRQEDPDRLEVRRFGQPAQVYERHPKGAYLHDSARAACRFPGGHPEGFLEAFANLYAAAFDDMAAWTPQSQRRQRETMYPNVYDGYEGVCFVEQCAASHRENGAWKPLRLE